MITLPAYLVGFSSRSDGSAGIRFTTQELNGEQFAALKNCLNDYGYLMFKPNEITPADIPTEDAEDTSKTPSKRLRATLFIYWKQNGSKGDFETYYRETMEKFITQVKSKLD